MSDNKAALERWRKQLGNITMPMLSNDEAVEEMLSAGVGLDRIRTILDHDPPLALDIVLAAGRLPNAPEFIQSLHHAVNLMGLARVQNFVRARSVRRIDPDNPTHRVFLETVAVSRFAATLVTRWEEPRAPGSGAYLSCVTLLLSLARWKLTLADPKLARKIEEYVASGERRSVVEVELLGCSIDELNHAVLLDVGFPPDSPLAESLRLDNTMLIAAARCAWMKQLAPEISPSVGRWLRHNMLPPMLAHLLAWAAHDGWYSHRTLLLHRVVSARENKPLDTIIADVHRSAAHAVRSLGDLGAVILSPAERLFHAPPPLRLLRDRQQPGTETQKEAGWPPKRKPVPEAEPVPPPRKRVDKQAEPLGPTPIRQSVRPSTNSEAAGFPPPRQTTVESSATEAASKPGHTAVRGNTAVLQGFVSACRNKEYSDLRTVMTHMGDALDKGLNLRRTLIMLHPPKKPTLKGFISHGFDAGMVASALEFPVSEGVLLSRLLEKGSNLHVMAEQTDTALKQLPAILRDLALASGFMLGSIRMGEKSVGLVWSDTGEADVATSLKQYEAFRIVINHFNASFTHIAQSARKR